jgi:hypothetical protein
MNYLIPPPPLARASYKTSFTIQHNSHYCLKTTCWGCGSKARQGFLNEVPPRDRSFTVMTQLMHLHLVYFAGRRSRIRGWRLELVLVIDGGSGRPQSWKLRHHCNIVGGSRSPKAPRQSHHGRGHTSASDWLDTEILVNYKSL